MISGNVILKLVAAIIYFFYEKCTNCVLWMRKGRKREPPRQEQPSSIRLKDVDPRKPEGKDNSITPPDIDEEE